MSKLQDVIELSKPVNFQKVVSRPIHPLSDDIIQSPLADKSIYSKTLEEDFCFENLVVISGDFYDDIDLVNEEMRIIDKKSKFSPDYLQQKAIDAETHGEKMLNWCKKIADEQYDYSDITGAQKLLNEFIAVSNDFIPYMIFTLSAGSYLENVIKKSINELVNDEKKAQEDVLTLTIPDRPNVQSVEQHDFLSMMTSSAEISDEKLDEHLKKYAHIGFRWGIAPSWTREDLRERMKNTHDPKAELEKLTNSEAEMRTAAKDLLDRLGANEKMRDNVALAKKYVWLRTYRSDTISFSLAYLGSQLDKFYIAAGYNPNDYQFLTIDDIQNNIKVSQEEIAERNQSFAVVFVKGKKYYFSGDESVEFKKFLDTKVVVSNEIKGAVAHRTVNEVMGKVRIVTNPSELPLVQEGEILVASMTTPNFIQAMKKASGFITDEGGILCHAAIISREMNKPCIVGTGNATQALKNGDMVHMDLLSGEVTKL